MNLKSFLLFPFSMLYGFLMGMRNLLFSLGLLRQKSHPVKVISVGNLSMGGTGKTPHVEFIVDFLKDQYQIATLSRGYGRKTKGFVLADENSNSHDIGDESLQYSQKFDKVLVGVSGNRNKGVKALLKANPDLDCIILDDAFQHRYIKRDINIIITDFHAPFHKGFVFPAGRLREFRAGFKRADIIIVSKTPVVLSPFTRRRLDDEMKIKPYQKLLFSKIEYDGIVNIKTGRRKSRKTSTIVLFTGIANSYPLQDYLKNYCNELVVLTFPDHHEFSEKDINLIHQTFLDQFTSKKILVTTEKDAKRLQVSETKDILFKYPLYFVPIHIAFHDDDEDVLKKSIKNIFI